MGLWAYGRPGNGPRRRWDLLRLPMTQAAFMLSGEARGPRRISRQAGKMIYNGGEGDVVFKGGKHAETERALCR